MLAISIDDAKKNADVFEQGRAPITRHEHVERDKSQVNKQPDHEPMRIDIGNALKIVPERLKMRHKRGFARLFDHKDIIYYGTMAEYKKTPHGGLLNSTCLSTSVRSRWF